jgi:hypothetical protein
MLPMQKATYRGRATGCGFGVSEAKGTTQIAVTFEILNAEENGDHVPTGESITWIGHFTDKTTARTIESLQILGWTGDDLSELEDLDAGRCAELLPNVADIVCEPEEYEGQWTLKVRWVNRPGAGKFAFKAPLTGSALKSFAAQMKGQIRGARQGARPSGGPQARSNGGTQSQHPNRPGFDDDIPF